jgi:hypothetical protein
MSGFWEQRSDAREQTLGASSIQNATKLRAFCLASGLASKTALPLELHALQPEQA